MKQNIVVYVKVSSIQPIKANWTPCEPLALYCPPTVTRVRPEERNIALIHSAHTHAHTQKPNAVTHAGSGCSTSYKT